MRHRFGWAKVVSSRQLAGSFGAAWVLNEGTPKGFGGRPFAPDSFRQ